MKSKRWMALLMSVLMVFAFSFGSIGIAAADTSDNKCGDNVTWSVDGDTLTISGSGAMYDYEQRYGENRAPWQSGNYASKTDIAHIVIEDGITYIGDWAFAEIENVESVTLPDSVTEVGKFAFGYCYGLKTVDLGDGLKNIGYCMFYADENLESVTMSSNLEIIEEGGFYACHKLSNVVLPNGLKTIGTNAFFHCYGIKNITIPSTVTKIELQAFAECRQLESIVIPASVTDFGNSMFINCTSLKNVTFQNTLTSIGLQTFSECSSLKTLTIPEGVEEIGANAFAYCSSMTDLYLPSTLEYIDYAAFRECGSLSDIYFAGTFAQWKAVEIGTYNEHLDHVTVHCQNVEDTDATVGIFRTNDESVRVGDDISFVLELSDDIDIQNLSLQIEYDEAVLELESIDYFSSRNYLMFSEDISTNPYVMMWTSAQDISLNPSDRYGYRWYGSSEAYRAINVSGTATDLYRNSASSTDVYPYYYVSETDLGLTGETPNVLARLNFHILDSATVGETTVKVGYYKGIGGNYVDGTNVNFNSEGALNLAYQNCTIEISDYYPGDVNNDSCVDFYDAIDLMRYIVGNSVSVNTEALDIDDNDVVDPRDTVRLLQYLNGWRVSIH